MVGASWSRSLIALLPEFAVAIGEPILDRAPTLAIGRTHLVKRVAIEADIDAVVVVKGAGHLTARPRRLMNFRKPGPAVCHSEMRMIAQPILRRLFFDSPTLRDIGRSGKL